MSNEVFLPVLASALMNAAWNSLIKVDADRLRAMAITTLLASVVSFAVLPWSGLPQPPSWGLLALSIAVHTAYHFVLPLAYNHGDLGQIYPMARGSAPLFVMMGAALLAGESPGAWQAGGVAVLCAGVLALALRRGLAGVYGPALGYALLTGVLVAAYTVVDGLGARQSQAAVGYAVALTIGDGIATALIVLAWKGRAGFAADGRTWGLCGCAALLQLGASWIAVWALSRAPMAAVSALRETSVLWVALISTLLLKERLGLWRGAAVGLVFAGILLIRLGQG